MAPAGRFGGPADDLIRRAAARRPRSGAGPARPARVRAARPTRRRWLARLAGTPIPVARAVKSMPGLDRSSRLRAASPALTAPTRSSSMPRIAYRRLLKMTVVTSSCSLACVHSAEIVYMALPSASSARTGRPGQAIAAPVASGRPWPMAPPVSVSQSCGGAPAVAAGQPQARGVGLVAHDRRLGQQRADDGRRALAVRSPSGSAGRSGCCGCGSGVRRDQVGEGRQRSGDIVARLGEHGDAAAGRHRRAGLARDRRRTTPAAALRPGSGAGCRRAARRRTRPGRPAARPAGCPRPARAWPGRSRRAAARRGHAQAAGCLQAGPPQRRRRRAGCTHGSPLRSAAAAASITSPGTGAGGLTSAGGAGSAPSVQDTSAGQDERGDLARRRHGGGHRLGRVRAHVGRAEPGA